MTFLDTLSCTATIFEDFPPSSPATRRVSDHHLDYSCIEVVLLDAWLYLPDMFVIFVPAGYIGDSYTCTIYRWWLYLPDIPVMAVPPRYIGDGWLYLPDISVIEENTHYQSLPFKVLEMCEG